MRKEEIMFCTKCGNQIPDGSAVCPICGAQFAAPQAAPVAPQAAPQPAPAAPQYAPVQPAAAPKAKKAGGNKLPLIIGAIAAVAVIAIVLILILHDGAKALVKDYKNLEEDSKSKAYDMMVITSKKALKALDLDKDDDDDDDDDDVGSWKIKGSKSYSGKDSAFKGVCAYIEKTMKGETKKVSKMTIVEVKTKGAKKDTYEYFTCLKISGKWYILDSTSSAENIKDVANKWADYAKDDD